MWHINGTTKQKVRYLILNELEPAIMNSELKINILLTQRVYFRKFRLELK